MANRRNNILLVPTDFSEICQNAIDHAVDLASQVNFKVTLLHIIDRDSRAKSEENPSSGAEFKLQQIVDKIRNESGITADFIIREGNIFDDIGEVAKEIGANMLILGTHGKKGLQYLFGSHAMKVIAHSPVAVIVVQKRKISHNGYQKLVFPVGLYTEARQQVSHAIAASHMFGSDILMFQQVSPNEDDNSKIGIISKQIEKEFEDHDVKFTVASAGKTSNFSKQLIDFAITNNADLILMMTDSNINNPDFNNSSWSEQLIFNDAQIPVMCINPTYIGQIYFSL